MLFIYDCVCNIMLFIYVLALWSFSFLISAECVVLEGKLSTKKDWTFLGRFCFLSDTGKLEFKFTYPLVDCCNNVLMYFDGDSQWLSVYKNESKTCHEKENVLDPENNQIINLTTDYTWSGCKVVNSSVDEQEQLLCEGGRSFRSVVERWWYIAISNCENEKGIHMTYELKLTNGKSYWTMHFSADEFGILESDIFFLALFAVMIALSAYIAAKLQSRQMLHVTYKIFVLCLCLEDFGLLVLTISLGTFASDGVSNDFLNFVGRSFGAGAEICFLLLLLLLASGFTVTRGRLSYGGTIKLTVFMTVYIVVYATLFLYYSVFSDPGRVLYEYESSAGVGVIFLRLSAWIWFTQAILITLKRYPEKDKFYYPLYVVYSLWFFSQPIMVLFATNLIPKYMRAKLVNWIGLVIDLMSCSFFLALMRPEAANRNFPYHVRTSQIGSCENDQASSSFPHSVYQQSTTEPPQRVIYDVFTVQAISRCASSPDAAEPSRGASPGGCGTRPTVSAMGDTSETRSSVESTLPGGCHEGKG